MENWQIALINETRRRQDQIVEAEMDRIIKQVNGRQPVWQRAYQKLVLLLADLLIGAGTRLQGRYIHLAAHPAAGAEANPCT